MARAFLPPRGLPAPGAHLSCLFSSVAPDGLPERTAGLTWRTMVGPRRLRKRGLHAFVWLTMTLSSLARLGSARAEQPPARLRIDYQADPTCPSREELMRQVQARTNQAQWAGETESAWKFTVRVSLEPGRARAELAGRDPFGSSFQRTLVGRDCDEVVEALGLILALTVDSRARIDRADSLAAPSPSPPQVAPASTQPSEPPSPPVVGSAPPSQSSRWALGGGVHALMALGIAPAAMPGVEVFIDTTRVGEKGWRPSFRVSGRRAQAGGMHVAGGEISFTLMVAGLEACPTTVGLSRLLAVYPCAYGEWGTLRAAGYQVAQPRSVSRMWLSLGPALRGDLVLAPRLRLETRIALDLPLGRGRFWFLPRMVHEVAPVGLRWGVGLAARLP